VFLAGFASSRTFAEALISRKHNGTFSRVYRPKDAIADRVRSTRGDVDHMSRQRCAVFAVTNSLFNEMRTLS
jgi:hypothetical protein